MAYKVTLTTKALKHAQAAYAYYEGISAVLGDRFHEQLRHALNSLSTHPTNFGFIDDRRKIRDLVLKKFPYTIIYRIEIDEVIIIKIHNCYQHPNKRYK